MDAPPKLYDLAFEVVVNYYTTGLLPTKVIPSNTTVSDQIFETVMKIRCHCYDDHTKRLMKEFKPTKLELNLEEFKQGSFSEIRKLKLVELKLRNFREISKYIVRVAGPPQRGKRLACMPARGQIPRVPRKGSDDDDDDVPMSYGSMPEHFFIVHFLGDILSEESKRELRVLDISGYGTFGDKWMEAVSLMFPKLEVLNIKGREFSDEDFAIFCKSLTNLHTLRIGHKSLETLNGISKLKNLKNLAIDQSVFRNKEDVEELFKLKNLKTLSLSHNSRVGFNYDFYFVKPLPELTHLEIMWGDADDGFLKKILQKLPKLQVVVANDTKIHENAAPPSVTVYTSTGLNTIMKSLSYFRTTGNRKEIVIAIQKFWEIYRNWNVRRTCTPDQLTVCVNEVELLLETFKFDKGVVEDVNSCVDVFASFAMGDGHLNVNKLKIVGFLLKNLKNHLKTGTPPDNSIFKMIWLDVSRFIRNTENLNIDEIAALAMQSIIHGGGALYWEQFCAEVLEEILDRMDLSSESYKKISFRKLHECLTIIHKNVGLFADRRARAGDVLRYIELFM